MFNYSYIPLCTRVCSFRYMVLEITPHNRSDKPLILKTTALHGAIQQEVQKLYGDFGVAAIKAGFNGNSIFCNNNNVSNVILVLILIQ